MTEIPWTWLGIRASGITAWGLLTAVVLWGILLRTRLLGRLASPMRLLDLHRWLGATALAFLLVHMILLLVDPAVQFTVAQVLVPGLAPWEPLAAALGTIRGWARSETPGSSGATCWPTPPGPSRRPTTCSPAPML